MSDFSKLLKEKNDRLEKIPETLLTVAQKQEKKVVSELLSLIGSLDTKGGYITINAANVKKIDKIVSDLKDIMLSDEYVSAVKKFAKEFDTQAKLNSKIIDASLGETVAPVAAELYINNAKKSTIDALLGSGLDANLFNDIKDQLEQSVINGASLSETITSLRTYVEGDKELDSKIGKYIKQVSVDAFAIADRSYTSILADFLESEWFYYAGGESGGTRCFCQERYDKYYYYKEIESWGDGKNLGDCNIGGGRWAGMIEGTNAQTIYSYLGGYNCAHSLIPVSEFIVDSDAKERAKKFGWKENNT